MGRLTTTWIEPEERAGPNNAMRRKGRAWLRVDDGKVLVAFRAAVADTFFTCPAFIVRKGKRVKGYLTAEDGVLFFNAYRKREEP